MKNVAVISGGGSMGAFTVGRLKKLDKNYDLIIGCSTGSLIAPLAILGEWDRLEEAYTSVTQESIFNVNPFNKKGNIKMFNTVWRIITGKKTIGETKNLRKLIEKNFTIEDYNKIRNLRKDVIVTVCNIRKKEDSIEYKSILDCDYEEFLNYIWASCNVPIVTSLLETKEGSYVDGGLVEVTPLQHIFSFNEKPENIDCFVHSEKSNKVIYGRIRNIFHLIGRSISVLRNEITKDDILIGSKLSEKYGSKLNLYYLPYKLTNNALIFNKQEMKRWVKEGYDSV
jgi:predicted acylesterase/phospholipase RssA